MTDADLIEFSAVFQDLRRVFPTRSSQDDLNRTMRLYFATLQPWPIDYVTEGATRWISTGERFPRPHDWISVMPGAPPEWVAPLPDEEADEHLKAMRQNYKADPCQCFLCRKSGVSHRLLRYVPDYDQGDPAGQARIGTRVVSRGHWAHGEELRSWYVARDNFFAALKKTKPRTMPEAGRMVPIGETPQKKSIFEVHQESEETE